MVLCSCGTPQNPNESGVTTRRDWGLFSFLMFRTIRLQPESLGNVQLLVADEHLAQDLLHQCLAFANCSLSDYSKTLSNSSTFSAHLLTSNSLRYHYSD